jgi:hypothetical protein
MDDEPLIAREPGLEDFDLALGSVEFIRGGMADLMLLLHDGKSPRRGFKLDLESLALCR